MSLTIQRHGNLEWLEYDVLSKNKSKQSSFDYISSFGQDENGKYFVVFTEPYGNIETPRFATWTKALAWCRKVFKTQEQCYIAGGSHLRYLHESGKLSKIRRGQDVWKAKCSDAFCFCHKWEDEEELVYEQDLFYDTVSDEFEEKYGMESVIEKFDLYCKFVDERMKEYIKNRQRQ